MKSDISALIERSREGDREAFEELMQRHRRMVHGLVTLVGRGRLDEEDLVQDVFLEVWRSLETLREPLRFLPWLQMLTRNKCRSELRRKRVELSRENVEVDELEAKKPALSKADELFEDLPGDIARVMREKFCEDRSYQEIAERLQMTMAQVRYQMEKGLRQIARRMQAEKNEAVEVPR